MTKCRKCDHESWLLNQFEECPNCLGWDTDTDQGQYFIDQKDDESDRELTNTDQKAII